jgi:hypothetical protein
MPKQRTWRVRVVRKAEDWVDVVADTPLQAENLAAVLPQVISVFTGSALRGDRPVGQNTPPVGVEDDEEDQYNG